MTPGRPCTAAPKGSACSRSSVSCSQATSSERRCGDRRARTGGMPLLDPVDPERPGDGSDSLGLCDQTGDLRVLSRSAWGTVQTIRGPASARSAVTISRRPPRSAGPLTRPRPPAPPRGINRPSLDQGPQGCAHGPERRRPVRTATPEGPGGRPSARCLACRRRSGAPAPTAAPTKASEAPAPGPTRGRFSPA